MKNKIKKILKTIFQFIVNPRLLLCFGLAWLITNGWSYILLGIGTFMDIKWMVAVGSSYLAILWLPITPEKIITVSLSIALLRVLFPNDQKTLAVLKVMYEKAKRSVKKIVRKKEVTRKKIKYQSPYSLNIALGITFLVVGVIFGAVLLYWMFNKGGL